MEIKNHGTVVAMLMKPAGHEGVLPLPQIARLPAMMTQVVLENVFVMLSVNDLKFCREVCKTWNAAARLVLAKKSITMFGKFIMGKVEYPYLMGRVEERIGVDMDSLEEPKLFLKFVEQMDNGLGLPFRQLVFKTELLTNSVGKLLRSPFLTDIVTTLDIYIVINQLDRLKQCIQGLPQLKEINVKLLYGFNDAWDSILAFDDPEECWTTISSRARKDLSLQAVSIWLEIRMTSSPVHYSSAKLKDIEEAENFSYWLIRRSPKLEKFYRNHFKPKKGLQETIHQISREYRGKGFKELGFASSTSDNGFPLPDGKPKAATLHFLRLHCGATLEALTLRTMNEDVNLKELFASPDFPRDTSKALSIAYIRKLDASDFSWNFVDNVYTFTEKFSGDFLDVFPLRKPLHNLRDLSIIIENHVLLPQGLVQPHSCGPNNKLYVGRTCRVFHRVEQLYVDIETEDMITDIIHDFPTAFPVLKKLTAMFIDNSQCNLLLRSVPTNLELLQIEGCGYVRLTDEEILANDALYRLQDLREFSFTSKFYLLTDTIIYKGLLRLPLLRTVKFPFSRQGEIQFSQNALDALLRHVEVYDCCEYNCGQPRRQKVDR